MLQIKLYNDLHYHPQNGFFLPLSGGVDSTSTAIIVFNMCRLVVEAVAANDTQALRDVRNVVGDQDYTPTTPQDLAGITMRDTLTVHLYNAHLSIQPYHAGRIFHTTYMGTANSGSETRQRAAAFAKEVRSCGVASS